MFELFESSVKVIVAVAVLVVIFFGVVVAFPSCFSSDHGVSKLKPGIQKSIEEQEGRKATEEDLKSNKSQESE